ncbi:hypothetical protein CEP54_014681 [Fusarium duplospermum]|uniref:Uncharacterized protein n=1 Tax=Fusarium duplospermum TaxID=1325734 RepID=A0A428NUK1_9HYPO|nr:hypothetical protein CEP54_014681 [Fusarium duplospermum]
MTRLPSGATVAHPDKKQLRCDGYLRQIAEAFGLSSNDVRQKFSSPSDSASDSTSVDPPEAFLRDLRDLVRDRPENVDWAKLVSAVEQGRKVRQDGRFRGTKRDAPWQSFDVLQARATLGIPKPERADKPAKKKQKQHHDQGGAPPRHDPDQPDSDESTTSLAPSAHVVFCGVTEYANISSDGFSDILSLYPEDRRAFGKVLSKLSHRKLQELEDKLGPGLCSNTGAKKVQERDARDKENSKKQKKKGKKKKTTTESSDMNDLNAAEMDEVHLHQSVLTMLWAEQTKRVSVDYLSWELVVDTMKDNWRQYAKDKVINGRDIIFFLPAHGHHWRSTEEFDSIYQKLESVPNSTVYPSYEEAFSHASKAPDIIAFDTIAERAPERFAYRPKSCLGGDECQLAQDDTKAVFKQTFSSAGINVLIDEEDQEDLQRELTCSQPGEARVSSTGAPSSGQEPTYFHQEYVDSLRSWGEIHVFMVKDEPVKLAFSFPQKGNEISVTALEPEKQFAELGRSRAKRQEKFEELRHFCRWWRNALLEYEPTQFKTLNVGVRFEVGISEATNDGLFFLLNCKRWPGAPYFSKSQLLEPCDQLCELFGREFGRQHGERVPVENDEDEAMGE